MPRQYGAARTASVSNGHQTPNVCEIPPADADVFLCVVITVLRSCSPDDAMARHRVPYHPCAAALGLVATRSILSAGVPRAGLRRHILHVYVRLTPKAMHSLPLISPPHFARVDAHKSRSEISNGCCEHNPLWVGSAACPTQAFRSGSMHCLETSRSCQKSKIKYFRTTQGLGRPV